MRRRAALLAAGAAGAAAMLAAAPTAVAAPATIIGGTAAGDFFSAPSYAHEAGTTATLTWAGGGSHNATAGAAGPDGKPLFRSDTIPSGTTPVRGTQYLPLGSYPFSCTIHLGMNSTLDVNSGTPQPRPTVAVKLTSTKLAKVVAKRKVATKVTLTGTEAATVTVRLGKKQLGTATTAKSGGLPVKLSAKNAAALGAKRKAKLKLEASVDFGSPAKASGTLK
ncbi:MAG TPA: hypothetical protein VHH72_09360 [Solirubrobacterales bacterium]|jgi:plastocyanin|nr:hypothetical protein [Solirubrobacterales bacterium]